MNISRRKGKRERERRSGREEGREQDQEDERRKGPKGRVGEIAAAVGKQLHTVTKVNPSQFDRVTTSAAMYQQFSWVPAGSTHLLRVSLLPSSYFHSSS